MSDAQFELVLRHTHRWHNEQERIFFNANTVLPSPENQHKGVPNLAPAVRAKRSVRRRVRRERRTPGSARQGSSAGSRSQSPSHRPSFIPASRYASACAGPQKSWFKKEAKKSTKSHLLFEWRAGIQSLCHRRAGSPRRCHPRAVASPLSPCQP